MNRGSINGSDMPSALGLVSRNGSIPSTMQEDSDCWSETPEYFRQVAWPGYVSNREGIRNVPGVIYLDSTTSTVDQQLVEVLKRLLSHLQDQL